MTAKRTILITGTTDGLGRALAERLAADQVDLILHGRDPDKLAHTADALQRTNGGSRPRTVLADLAELAQVGRLADEVGKMTDRLDVLVNNAGIGGGLPDARTRQTSADGYELRFAVNYLAGFRLTLGLLPLLRSGAPARIVNVASLGQHRLDFADLMLERRYDGTRAYAQSKLAQIMSGFELAKRLAATEVTVNSLHPATYMPTKIVLSERLLETDIADDPFFRNVLFGYFPEQMRQDYRPQMEAHQLHREIVVTELVNYLVNRAGITFYHRLAGETGASVAMLTRANFVAREVFGAERLWRHVASFDNRIAAAVQTRIRLHSRRLVERGTRWLLNNRPQPLQIAETIDAFGEGVASVWAHLPKLLRGADLEWYQGIHDELTDAGVPEELAARVAGFSSAFPALDIVAIAHRTGKDPLDVAEVYYDLADRLDITQLLDRIIELPRSDRWQSMARAAIREDLFAAHAALTQDVLAVGDGAATPEQRFGIWEENNAALLSRARTTLEEIKNSEAFDLANLSVAMRTMRTLLRRHG